MASFSATVRWRTWSARACWQEDAGGGPERRRPRRREAPVHPGPDVQRPRLQRLPAPPWSRPGHQPGPPAQHAAVGTCRQPIKVETSAWTPTPTYLASLPAASALDAADAWTDQADSKNGYRSRRAPGGRSRRRPEGLLRACAPTISSASTGRQPGRSDPEGLARRGPWCSTPTARCRPPSNCTRRPGLDLVGVFFGGAYGPGRQGLDRPEQRASSGVSPARPAGPNANLTARRDDATKARPAGGCWRRRSRRPDVQRHLRHRHRPARAPGAGAARTPLPKNSTPAATCSADADEYAEPRQHRPRHGAPTATDARPRGVPPGDYWRPGR